MTGTLFVILLSAFSALSALVVEAIKTTVKKVKGKKMPSGSAVIASLIVSFVVGCGGTAIFYMFKEIPYGAVNDTCIFLMGLATALVSQVGYDKVHEIIKRFC